MAEVIINQLSKVFPGGFIGSPAMNLAHGRIEGSGAEPVLVLGDHRWPLPSSIVERTPALRDWAGRPVVVGLRPGALALLEPADEERPPRICVTAVSVESLGDGKTVLFRPPFEGLSFGVPSFDASAGAGRTPEAESERPAMWTARVEPDAAVFTGQAVTLRLDLGQAYFFDAESGNALDRATHAAVSA